MNAPQREIVRLSLLRHLDAATGATAGLGEALLRSLIGAEGSRVTEEQLKAELQYLEDKGFVRPAPKQISPELKLWQITAAGRDFFAST